MASELRRFPSLDSKTTLSSRHTRCQPSVSTSLTSLSSSLSRFPSLRSTRPSTVTTVTTATSPSLLTRDDEHAESSNDKICKCADSIEAVNGTLYEEVPLLSVDSIRILRVKPGSPGMPLDCELLTTSLQEQKNRYSALSYTWEREIASVPVRVNGHLFELRRNLVDFICTLRSPNRHIKVWADAICIDQQSPTERNHQVQLMSRIYSDAACTQSWLGHDMPALASQMKLMRKGLEPSDVHSTRGQNMGSEHVLLALLNHRYWTRTWIIQEILLAKEVWVHCGNEALRWNDLVKMARHLAISSHPPSLRCLQLFRDSSLMHLQNMWRSTRSRGLPELLTEYTNTGCENVQDRVFGLIGLVNDLNDPLFASDISEAFSQNRREIVNYSLPLKDLFRKLMEMYPPLPARSFALPLWSALELDYFHFDSFDFCRRIRIQGFPCSMLTMSGSHSRTLNGAVSTMNLDDTTREELLCLSDPHSKTEARQSRVCVAIRVRNNDFQTSEQYLASACLVEPRWLALDHMDYDNLCRAFESTRVYRKPRSNDTVDIWAVNLPLAAFKVLHAISNPAAGQRMLDALAEDILDTDELDDDIAEWAEATKNLAMPSSDDTNNPPTYEDEHLPQEPISKGLLRVGPPKPMSKGLSLVTPPEPVREQELPPRSGKRYKVLKRAGLSGFYDWCTRPLYGDKSPAWE